VSAEMTTQNLDEPDDCIHTHPISPEEISRYSVTRDSESENDIANYVHGQAPDEDVLHVEKVKTEYIIGESYEIWDVTTDKNRWWVITNLTNLYSQKHFPSLDYTLSFHVGLMMRLRSKPETADSATPHPFDEVFRRQQQAKDKYDRAIEAEDYQAVGMQLRECLLSVVNTLKRRIELPDQIERPKEGNFIGWYDIFMNQLCPSEHNKELRQYLKKSAEKTWQLVSWLTHCRNPRDVAASIAIHACDTLIGHSVQLVEREETSDLKVCPLCTSRNIRTHFDIEIEPDGDYFMTCGVCGWSSHPTISNNQDNIAVP